MNQQITAGIPLRELHVGHYNPRKTIIRDTAWEEFKASILAMGIKQPILVRPVVGKKTPYEIVAGQRRFMAAWEVFNDLDWPIPVLLEDMTDEEALAASTAENIERAPMSASEEAEAAAHLLAKCNGNREEVAKRMGWSPATLNNRLKLMACSDNVRKAQSEQVIELGLAEMLSGLTYAQQDELLAKFIKEGVPTVQDAKAVIMTLTKSLTTAIFPKDDCTTCAHNSARQQSMFANIEEGHCLNAECFDKKTEAQLTATAESLKDDFQIIKIVRPGDNFSVRKLSSEDVGDQQAVACRNCSNFGAAVSGMPNKLGLVSRGLCFDAVCNDEKKRLAQEAKDAAAKAKQEAAAAAASVAQGADSSQEASQGGTTSDTGEAKPAKSTPRDLSKEKTSEPTVMLTNAVHEYRDKLYRGIIKKEFALHPEKGAMLVLALLVNRKGSYFSADDLTKALAKAGMLESESMSTDLAKSMKVLLKSPIEKAKNVLPNLGAIAIEAMTRQELTALAKLSGVDLGQYFHLNDEAGKLFLEALTKNQIVIVCDELGISAKMGQTFRSISGGKKDEFIKQITTIADFDYNGKVPSVLKPAFAM